MVRCSSSGSGCQVLCSWSWTMTGWKSRRTQTLLNWWMMKQASGVNKCVHTHQYRLRKYTHSLTMDDIDLQWRQCNHATTEWNLACDCEVPLTCMHMSHSWMNAYAVLQLLLNESFARQWTCRICFHVVKWTSAVHASCLTVQLSAVQFSAAFDNHKRAWTEAWHVLSDTGLWNELVRPHKAALQCTALSFSSVSSTYSWLSVTHETAGLQVWWKLSCLTHNTPSGAQDTLPSWATEVHTKMHAAQVKYACQLQVLQHQTMALHASVSSQAMGVSLVHLHCRRLLHV